MQLRHRSLHLRLWLILAPLIAIVLILSITRRQELPPQPTNAIQIQP